MIEQYNVFLYEFYKDVAIEINEMSSKDGLYVLPMSVNDMNIDVDECRLLVYIDDNSRIIKFKIG
jgi:hypothetical protein